jgi:hypothetical protein
VFDFLCVSKTFGSSLQQHGNQNGNFLGSFKISAERRLERG